MNILLYPSNRPLNIKKRTYRLLSPQQQPKALLIYYTF